MTHFKTFILSCLLALAAFPVTAKASDFTVDGFHYSITSTTPLTVEVESGPDEADVTVPSTVVFRNRTFRVTGISYYAFRNHTNLRSVDMPSITYIEDGNFNGAFEGCSNLSDVNMPAATSIGNCAFWGCDALTSVSLPAATSIDYKAFSDCSSLCDIYVGDQPAQCSDDSFSKITYATATLHVPAGCASKYKEANSWKNFAFISEDYDPTGIKNTKVNDVKIYTVNGSVQLTGLKEGEKVLFYSLDGKLIGAQKANSGTISITTSEPVVICKMGGKSIKILVK